ncbi:hypothetical protein EXIGLDRAFT_784241 [Exidia glandulosa HHB12029]|uniref:Uncharacterized protein n=1 Tax=Exidia glandulosa HHB12029 TaxID=1314781 RepID=A0A166MKW3_EXIGL|nr:hypothetical protein EXIGLDRAFT_784241 [Exidia glandulosa HHB12029]
MDPPPGEEDHREAEKIPPHGPQRLALAMKLEALALQRTCIKRLQRAKLR